MKKQAGVVSVVVLCTACRFGGVDDRSAPGQASAGGNSDREQREAEPTTPDSVGSPTTPSSTSSFPLVRKPAPKVSIDPQGQLIVDRMMGLRAFTGVISEKGVLPAGILLKSRVSFQAPNRFEAQVVAPSSVAGIRVGFDGKTLVFIYPQLRWAVRILGYPSPTEKQIRLFWAQRYKSSQARYFYRYGGGKRVAGLPTLALYGRARSKTNALRSSLHRVYQKYAFPLAGTLRFGSGTKYSYTYESVRFADELSQHPLDPTVPDGYLITEWNLHSKPIELGAARASAGFPLDFPEGSSVGLTRQRVIKPGDQVTPAYMAIYTRNISTALVTVVAAHGPPLAYGIPIDIAGAQGRLVLSPVLSSINFVHKGAHYTVMGDLAFEELIALARSIIK